MKTIKICTLATLACGLIAAVIGFGMFFSGKIDPQKYAKSAEDYYRIAEDYRKESNYQKAAVTYQKVLEKEENHVEALRGLAEMYIMLEYYEDAEVVYENLAGLEQVEEEDWLNYVETKIKLEKLEEAKQIVEKVLEMGDYEKLQVLYRQMELEKPVFNLQSGSYDEYQLLEADISSGYSIYYTRDGSEPTQDSPVYSDSIVISEPQNQIKAKAYSYLGYSSDTVELEIEITVPVEEIQDNRYDSLLYLVRSEVLNKEYNEPVYNYELAQIRELQLVGNRFSSTVDGGVVFYEDQYQVRNSYSTSRGDFDLEIIRHMPFLKELVVCWQDNVDLEPVSELYYLENLSLINNRINDISSLKDLKNLKVLSLGWNNIENISPLTDLTKLESLGLWNNRIRDISALGSLQNLTYLDVSGNQINNMEGLRNFTLLNELWINGNPASDTSVLDGRENLIIHQ